MHVFITQCANILLPMGTCYIHANNLSNMNVHMIHKHKYRSTHVVVVVLWNETNQKQMFITAIVPKPLIRLVVPDSSKQYM